MHRSSLAAPCLPDPCPCLRAGAALPFEPCNTPVPTPPLSPDSAFDGSPVTCLCLLVTVPKGQAYSLGHNRSAEAVACDQPAGYTVSGEYTSAGESR